MLWVRKQMSNAYITLNKTVSGSVKAPSSKSYAHRYLICASLAEGTSIIHDADINEDIMATIDSLRAMGAIINIKKNEESTDIFVEGKIDFKKKDVCIDAKSSATTMRFLLPIASLFDDPVRIKMNNDLRVRPQDIYNEIFRNYLYKDGEDYIITSKLKARAYDINGNISSQFISGLLLSLPLLRVDSMIRVIPPFSSSSYVDITIECLKKAGIKIERRGEYEFNIPANQSYKSFEVTVEGDYSGASNILALGALCGEVTLTNLYNHSLQGDKKIIEVLETMGAKTKITKSSVSTSKSSLGTIEIDVDNIIDLAPLIIVLACLSEGISYVYNVHRLRFKEQNRLDTIIEEMEKIGFYIENNNESLKVYGGINMDGPAIVSAHNDHRTFMALAVAACMIKNGLIIDGVECVNKSYPKFLDDLEKIGVNVNRSI